MFWLRADEFKVMHARHPQILFPAFRIQANMMMFTMGQKYWLAQREKLSVAREKDAKRLREAKKREQDAKRKVQLAYVIVHAPLPFSGRSTGFSGE